MRPLVAGGPTTIVQAAGRQLVRCQDSGSGGAGVVLMLVVAGGASLPQVVLVLGMEA